MKIDVCSDLHVDGWLNKTSQVEQSRFHYHIKWTAIKNADSTVLVIAGDTANNINMALEVVEGAIEAYDNIIFLDGNHDHYDNGGQAIDDTMAGLRHLCRNLTNVHYLAPDESVTIDAVTFIGGTGWYDWKGYEDKGILESTAKRAWSRMSNDARFLNHNGTEPNIRAFEQAINMAALVTKAQTDEVTEKIVMATHMSPRADLMEWRDYDDNWNELTPSYMISALSMVLDADTGNKISHWIYGHTHTRKITKIDRVTYVNNARGYPKENPPFTLTQIEV